MSGIGRWLKALRTGKLRKALLHLPGFVRLARACSLMSRNEPGKAVPLLEAAVLPDGPKQVAMVMRASCYSHLNQKDRAILTYSEAIASEQAWGGRSNRDASAYIVGYAEFFRSVALRSKDSGQAWDDLALYDRLLSLRTPDLLRDMLPLPSRSALRRGVR